MASENETVDDVFNLLVRYVRSPWIDIIVSTHINEYATRIKAAHEREVAALKAKVERLEAALRKIANASVPGCVGNEVGTIDGNCINDGECDACEYCAKKVAQSALACTVILGKEAAK